MAICEKCNGEKVNGSVLTQLGNEITYLECNCGLKEVEGMEVEQQEYICNTCSMPPFACDCKEAKNG